MNLGDNAGRKRPILVVTALTSELDAARAIDGVEVAFIGVGKVNAALATAQALLSEKRALVVNYGTCGKISKSLHGLVEISRVIQRDMMAMPLAPRALLHSARTISTATSWNPAMSAGSAVPATAS